MRGFNKFQKQCRSSYERMQVMSVIYQRRKSNAFVSYSNLQPDYVPIKFKKWRCLKVMKAISFVAIDDITKVKKAGKIIIFHDHLPPLGWEDQKYL